MEKLKVEDAVGMVLAHDLTKIVPGSFKGTALKKGHIIRAEDIEELKNIGKNHISVITLTPAQIHENEAAHRIANAVVSLKLITAEPREGKTNIHSVDPGLLKINREVLNELNGLGDIALVTLHDNSVVWQNELVAAAKIIPLVMEREKVEQAEEICRHNQPVIDVKPFFHLKTAIIVSGSEVYYGRIQDSFGEVLKAKINHYGGELFELRYAPDDLDFIYEQIVSMSEKGAEIILISGGMAVDADDVTPQAIQKAATEVVTYGVPVLPGAMCMVAYRQAIPIIGIPACAMFNTTTIFDIIYPRLLAKEHIRRNDLLSLAHGGMCLLCNECHYPVCPFGK